MPDSSSVATGRSAARGGASSSAAEQGGALLATLVRTHFRRLNLAYLDGAAAAPEFQHTIGYTLYQFGRVGGVWRTAAALTEALVLPGVRAVLPVSPYYDVAALILGTRFLRPLVGFGLAEERTTPYVPGEPIVHPAFRKAPLFDRVVTFRVSPGARGRGERGGR